MLEADPDLAKELKLAAQQVGECCEKEREAERESYARKSMSCPAVTD